MKVLRERVHVGEKLAYALGDMGACFMLDMVYLFQLYYYTDVLRIKAATAGMIVLIARVAGSLFDLPAGLLADRTRTRFGRFRPWVVGLTLPLALVYVFDFLSPLSGEWGKILYAAVSLSLFMMLFSLQNTPYSALGGVISGEEKVRASISSWRVLGSLMGGLVASVSTLPLAERLTAQFDSPALGWFLTTVVLATAAVPLMLASGFFPRERVQPVAVAARPSFWGSFRTVFRTPGALAVLLAGVAYSIGGGLSSNGFVYYFKYVGQDSAINYSTFAFVSQLATGLAVLFVTVPLTRRFSAVRVATCAYSGAALLSCLYFFLPATADVSLLSVCALRCIVYAPATALFWTLLARVADLAGGQVTALVFGLACLFTKCASALGNSLFGYGLSLAGYVPDAPASAGTALFLRLSVSFLPAVFLLFAALLVRRVAAAQEVTNR